MQKKFISTLLKDLKWLQFFFFPACHDLVNSHAGGSMTSCRSARLLKMQNTPGSQADIHITEAAGGVSECRHCCHVQSDILAKEAAMQR